MTLFAERALLPRGWARDVLFEIGADGDLAAVLPDAASHPARRYAPSAPGPVIPGMPNVHSHAFQRAMAGLTERSGGGGERDSFWTWRQLMYDFAGRLTPMEVEAIAAQLYVEMLKAGYTAVGEFHYLHHDLDGRAYADPAEMSERVIAAARAAGIGLTHLPVLYAHGGFGGAPPRPEQARFVSGLEPFLALVAALRRRHAGDPQLRVGIAPHSLRAVSPALLADAVRGLRGEDAEAPVHVHVAEQTKEVEDCLAWSGKRPVQWLLDHQPVDRRWCLVHATHMTAEETRAVAASGAVVGLCPTTEANLGDGLFPAPDYLAAGGLIGIGSDSHVSVSPMEELRWLEYGERLESRRRNVLAKEASVGATLYRAALEGGAQALARPIGRLAAGARADLLVIDGEAPTLLGKTGDRLLDACVFAGNVNPVRDVMVGGRWVVQERHHLAEEAVFARVRSTVAALVTRD
jgi:formimidoylglutamate deiminase